MKNGGCSEGHIMVEVLIISKTALALSRQLDYLAFNHQFRAFILRLVQLD